MVVSGCLHALRCLTARKQTRCLFNKEVGWAPLPISTFWRREMCIYASSESRYWSEVTGHLHAPSTLASTKRPQIQMAGWARCRFICRRIQLTTRSWIQVVRSVSRTLFVWLAEQSPKYDDSLKTMKDVDYSGINSTKSPSPGAGKVSEPRVMSQFERTRAALRVYTGVFLLS